MAFVYTGVTFCSRWCAYLVAKWFGVGGVCVAMGHAVVSGVVFVGGGVTVGCNVGAAKHLILTCVTALLS